MHFLLCVPYSLFQMSQANVNACTIDIMLRSERIFYIFCSVSYSMYKHNMQTNLYTWQNKSVQMNISDALWVANATTIRLSPQLLTQEFLTQKYARQSIGLSYIVIWKNILPFIEIRSHKIFASFSPRLVWRTVFEVGKYLSASVSCYHL